MATPTAHRPLALLAATLVLLASLLIALVHREPPPTPRQAASPAHHDGSVHEVQRFASLTDAQFESLVIAGQPFVVTDYGARAAGWPMDGWSCEEFGRRFPEATVVHHYVESRRAQSSMAEATGAAPQPTGCVDPEGPQRGPLYWGIKEAGMQGGGFAVPPSEGGYLRAIQRASALPYFLGEAQRADFLQTPEVWLSREGAGARAHADAHCGSTVSLQVSGAKRWRLGPMPDVGAPLRAAPRAPLFGDGRPYELPGGFAAG